MSNLPRRATKATSSSAPKAAVAAMRCRAPMPSASRMSAPAKPEANPASAMRQTSFQGTG